MIGHQQIIESRMNGYAPSDVFVHILPRPKHRKDEFQNPEHQIRNKEFPIDVWTGDSIAARADLSWAHGLVIHLMPGNSTIDKYVQWWIAFMNIEPKMLIGIDTDGELNEWKH